MTIKTETEAGQEDLITIALPYANGDLHLGHAAEAILGCSYARHRRLSGRKVTFISADDVHGSATDRRARELGLPAERVVAEVGKAHRADFARLNISFDAYGSTDSNTNKRLTLEIVDALKDAGLVKRKQLSQLYDEQAGEFLDDRRVSGECPSCGAHDQHGDGCEVCGSTYDATALRNPISRLSGARPILKTAEHLYLHLEGARTDIESWIASADLQTAVVSKLHEWLNEGLRDWGLTRRGPYFGFRLPDEDDLYIYVWVDAPVGYIATAFDHWVATRGEDRDWKEVWNNPLLNVLHIIGKDIVNHHGLLWPALLGPSGLRLPGRVHAHGFVTVDGRKMSKSNGTYVELHSALDTLDADSIRYALASRIGPSIGDFDLGPIAIKEKIDGELVGKIANIAVRLRPVAKRIGSHLSDKLHDLEAISRYNATASEVIEHFERMNLAAATRSIVSIADDANRSIAATAPWQAEPEIARAAMTDALCAFRIVACLLQPITPDFARRCLAIFGADQVNWDGISDHPLGEEISIPARLIERVSNEALELFEGESPKEKVS